MDEILQKLKRFKKSKFPTLTIILSTNEKRVPYPSFFLTQLHDLIHKNLNANQKVYFRQDLERMEAYLNESFEREKRTVVFFASPQNLWEVLDFEFSMSPVCIASRAPYLVTIEQALKVHPKYLVLLVDREKAKFFTVTLGKVEEVYDYVSTDVPQRVKAKKVDWGRYDKIPRHIEDHLHRHLKIISELARIFVEGRKIQYILLGSHKELLPKIKSHFKYPLNKMIKGEFITELKGPQFKSDLAQKLQSRHYPF
ncbi:hypothetical protein HYS95_01820 [Candidatus Daviesbacteria bacterium]|nr:hypothetical protein [Candidatus Daviesbacteria bacterium]